MDSVLIAWALPRLNRLLPIDDASLKEIITYSDTLSKEAAAAHLKNLLGDSPQALEFISSFNSRRTEVKTSGTTAASLRAHNSEQQSDSDSGHAVRRRPPKKVKPPIHSAGPVRRPEGYGNVTGGYKKSSMEEDYGRPNSKNSKSATAVSETLSLSKHPEALQLPTVTQTLSSPSPSSSRDPSPPRQKLPPSASGSLISDLPNVRTKQFRRPAHSGTSSPHKPITSTTTSSIAELTSAISALELSTNPTLSNERRKCSCNASIHPLFTTAPNCLSCGKIICALEGLQPCSFCDSPVLTKEQVNSMVRALKEERGQERMEAHNTSASHSGRGTPAFGGTTPETSGDESSIAASKARAHRDRLLAFQKENVQRTKIHDEAADYDISLNPGATQWMTPVQRAAALKKQQKYLREVQEQNKPEWEKKRTVLSMSIKNGKLVRNYETIKSTPTDGVVDQGDEADETVEDAAGHSKSGEGTGAFSRNPLLAGGELIRPIWKSSDGDKGKGPAGPGSGRGRSNVWRKVQDDDEDNEQWILDGGLHGYTQEDRDVSH